METFEFLLQYLRQYQSQVPEFTRMLAFLDRFCATFAEMDCLGIKQTRSKLELTHKRASALHPNDLIALLPDRDTTMRRSRRHEPRPVEFIFSATSESEARNTWTCHLLPKLPPAFQELYLRRLRDPRSVPDDLWSSFVELVLVPLGRVLEGRRISGLVNSQFQNHLWKRHAEWTFLRMDWLIATKRTAFEGPYDALNLHIVCLFQEELETIQQILAFSYPFSLHVLYAFLDLPQARRGNAKFLTKFFALAKSQSFIQALQHPLFHTGSTARHGIAACSDVATPSERQRVVELGATHGCHHCGHVHPQPKWAPALSYWILDHQPPRSKKFRAVMEQGVLLVGPILTDELVYSVGAAGEDCEAYNGLADYLRDNDVRFESRDGKKHVLLEYVKRTKKALTRYLNALSAYAEKKDGNTFRFFLHCHDCAGIQGGLVQSIVKLAEEFRNFRQKAFKKTASVKEQAYYLQCLAQLHDLLDQAFDPRRPLFRLEESSDCVSIPATRASGTTEQREALVKQSKEALEGNGVRSALGLENHLVLKVSGAACHSCKATVPAPRTLWTADHVAPSVLVELGLRQGPQILYSQCLYCRKSQSVLAAAFKRAWNASSSGEEWDQNWLKFLGTPVENDFIDPTQHEDDDDLLDDIDGTDLGSPLGGGGLALPPPMTGGGPETANVSRYACLAQDINTCGQRAAYNAVSMLANAGNEGALQAALANDVALRAIGPMGVNIADNDVRNLLDANGGQSVAVISNLQHVRNVLADPRNCVDNGDFALYGYMMGRAPTAYVVLNTLAGDVALPSASAPSTGSAKVGHYFAIRLSRDPMGGMVAAYADSLSHGAARAALLDSLRIAMGSA